jgi:hypothetical protein
MLGITRDHKKTNSYLFKTEETLESGPKMFPDGQYESWSECQRLLLYAKEVGKSTFDQDEED